jgi:Na+/H+ antiporter NhaC
MTVMLSVLGYIFKVIFVIGFVSILALWFFIAIVGTWAIVILIAIGILTIIFKIRKIKDEGIHIGFITILDIAAVALIIIFIIMPFAEMWDMTDCDPALEALSTRTSFELCASSRAAVRCGYTLC